jgi:hypothetical protein
MGDNVVGLSGHEHRVESVEHDAGLQIRREGPSVDPARTRRRERPRGRERHPTSAGSDVGHLQLVRPLGHEVAADEVAGGMMVCRMSRLARRACVPANARDPRRSHQPSNPVPTRESHRHSIRCEHAAHSRLCAIQRGSCGCGADRRLRAPEPTQVGSARRNSSKPKHSGPWS